MSHITVPVILCGGSGTRLWPVSRKMLPKQFLPLVSQHSMIQETVLRVAGISGWTNGPHLLCSEEHRFFVAEQLQELGIKPARIILEPTARNTAPALASAALSIAETDPNAVMLVLPADHVIVNVPVFHDAALLASKMACQGHLVTFGMVPQGPETGFGYIERGEPIDDGRSFRVERFVEKPTEDRARVFFESGRFYWNSGMFVMRADRYLDELSKYRPDILASVQKAWSDRREDLDFCRLEQQSFAACPAVSIDYAVMERTQNAVVVPAEMGWSDVGSWATLWHTAEKDSQGNAARGDVDLADSRNCYVRSESRFVAVSGLDDVIVVETADAVLVTRRDRAQSVKDVVSRLDKDNRTEHLNHTRVYRPWGYYETVDEGSQFQVKRLMVKPGQALSLQLHHKRAEHWVVVSGEARVTCGDKVVELHANQSTYIPIETKHRLENPGIQPLFVIEVQSGDYLGEDDIVRFEDRYSRS